MTTPRLNSIRRGRSAVTVVLCLVYLSLCSCSVELGRRSGSLQNLPLPGSKCEPKVNEPDLSVALNKSLASGPQKLPAPVLDLTPEVRREMERFGAKDGKFMSRALAQRDKYYPTLTQIFNDEGLPPQLLNLALIESGFNSNARSVSGAVGMWQFMKSTARLYGLKVERREDQRRDPVLSTIAAARHLRDLYSIYKDWHLVLAAYNAGPGAVSKALVRSGSSDFWSLARKGKLSAQTRNFVPRFIAATLIVDGHPSENAIAENLVGADSALEVLNGDRAENRAGNRYSSAG